MDNKAERLDRRNKNAGNITKNNILVRTNSPTTTALYYQENFNDEKSLRDSIQLDIKQYQEQNNKSILTSKDMFNIDEHSLRSSRSRSRSRRGGEAGRVMIQGNQLNVQNIQQQKKLSPSIHSHNKTLKSIRSSQQRPLPSTQSQSHKPSHRNYINVVGQFAQVMLQENQKAINAKRKALQTSVNKFRQSVAIKNKKEQKPTKESIAEGNYINKLQVQNHMLRQNFKNISVQIDDLIKKQIAERDQNLPVKGNHDQLRKDYVDHLEQLISNSNKNIESLMHEKARVILRNEQLQNFNYSNEVSQQIGDLQALITTLTLDNRKLRHQITIQEQDLMKIQQSQEKNSFAKDKEIKNLNESIQFVLWGIQNKTTEIKVLEQKQDQLLEQYSRQRQKFDKILEDSQSLQVSFDTIENMRNRSPQTQKDFQIGNQAMEDISSAELLIQKINRKINVQDINKRNKFQNDRNQLKKNMRQIQDLISQVNVKRSMLQITVRKLSILHQRRGDKNNLQYDDNLSPRFPQISNEKHIKQQQNIYNIASPSRSHSAQQFKEMYYRPKNNFSNQVIPPFLAGTRSKSNTQKDLLKMPYSTNNIKEIDQQNFTQQNQQEQLQEHQQNRTPTNIAPLFPQTVLINDSIDNNQQTVRSVSQGSTEEFNQLAMQLQINDQKLRESDLVNKQATTNQSENEYAQDDFELGVSDNSILADSPPLKQSNKL